MKYKALASAVPYHSFQAIMNRLQLKEDEFLVLSQHRDIFLRAKDDFAEFFYKSFLEIAETHLLLERYGRADSLKRTWSLWFERVFTERMDSSFITYLWHIGLKHVEINLDQRFTNLGFSLVRQFVHRIIREKLPVADAADVMFSVDKIIDFCTLVETSAYIDATARCDLEILKGISDRIRNPVTIIGGNLRRLQRKIDPQDPLFKDYSFLISYAGRCEDMVADINTYMDIFQREARFETCFLDTIIDNMLENLSMRGRLEGIKVEVSIGPDARLILGDPVDLRQLFYHLIENAAEAAASAKEQEPLISISSELETLTQAVRVDVFNSGETINLSNIENILTPFYSTKAHGSGLGLSIAKLAARKNFGDIEFNPVPHQGTKVSVKLMRAI
jgi:signal transduction histidine kinase